jgi:DNA invertase Pin-like site-specific DNA recombinase
MKAALYARVSKSEQQTLHMQIEAMSSYAQNRGWEIINKVAEVGSGAKERKKREELLKNARRRSIDVIIVWKLDRWGRSLPDLINSLQELNELGVGFVSITEALDLTSPTGRAMAGLLSVFAEFERDILKERIKAGIVQARSKGKCHGRPKTAALKADEVKSLFDKGLNKSEIARRIKIGRTSVIRILTENKGKNA